MQTATFGNCDKHPGFNMVNCPLCKLIEVKTEEEFKSAAQDYINSVDERIAAGEELINTIREKISYIRQSKKLITAELKKLKKIGND